jgi:hypothetical protein
MKAFAITSLLLLCAALGAADYPCRTIISTTPTYSTTTHDTTRSGVRRRDSRLVTDVLQINPAYTSAYSPDSYDAAAQAQLTQQLSALQLQIQQLSARLAATPPPATAPPVIVVAPALAGPAPIPGPATAPGPQSAPALLQANQIAAAALLLHQQQVAAQAAAAAQAAPLGQPVTASVGLLGLTAHCAACHTAGKLAQGVPFAILNEAGMLSPDLTAEQRADMLSAAYDKSMPPPGNAAKMVPFEDLEYAGLVRLLKSVKAKK